VSEAGFQKSHPFGDFPSLSQKFPYLLLLKGIEKGIKPSFLEAWSEVAKFKELGTLLDT
jgi:hypothetical protein